jgi:gamma-glutamylcyclotransferase (GGCT)/AIG2-like uncharacterized protein YtfP
MTRLNKEIEKRQAKRGDGGCDMETMPTVETTKVKIFVYGTLKKGGRFFNSYRFGNVVHSIKDATLYGYQLWKGIYPYIEEGAGVIHGEVHEYDESCLETFDLIEGNPTFYCREKLEITYDDETTEKVWVYLPVDPDITNNGELIEGGTYKI